MLSWQREICWQAKWTWSSGRELWQPRRWASHCMEWRHGIWHKTIGRRSKHLKCGSGGKCWRSAGNRKSWIKKCWTQFMRKGTRSTIFTSESTSVLNMCNDDMMAYCIQLRKAESNGKEEEVVKDIWWLMTSGKRRSMTTRKDQPRAGGDESGE